MINFSPLYADDLQSLDNNKIDTFSLNINNVYITEDTTLSNEYKKSLNFNGKSYIYEFYYKNNLTATIITPFFINGKMMEIDLTTLNNYIKNGYFNMARNKDKIDWNYYKVMDSTLIKYTIEYNSSSGWNVLNSGKVNEIIFAKKNDMYLWVNEDFNKNLMYSIPIDFKPDSSKSYFIKLFSKFLLTGKRRNYNDYKDFEKYINKK